MESLITETLATAAHIGAGGLVGVLLVRGRDTLRRNYDKSRIKDYEQRLDELRKKCDNATLEAAESLLRSRNRWRDIAARQWRALRQIHDIIDIAKMDGETNVCGAIDKDAQLEVPETLAETPCLPGSEGSER